MCSFTVLMHRRRKNYFFHRKFLFLYFSCQMGEWNSLEYRRVALYYYFVCIRDTKTVSAASRKSQPHPTNDFNNYKRIAHCMRTNKHLICIHVQTRFELIGKVFFSHCRCVSFFNFARPDKTKSKKMKWILIDYPHRGLSGCETLYTQLAIPQQCRRPLYRPFAILASIHLQ